VQLDVYGEPDIFVYFEMYITSTFHFHLPRLQVQTCTSPVDVSEKKDYVGVLSLATGLMISRQLVGSVLARPRQNNSIPFHCYRQYSCRLVYAHIHKNKGTRCLKLNLMVYNQIHLTLLFK